MAYITREAHGLASDGSRDILSLAPSSLAESTPVYMGTESLVREAVSMIAER
jgi:fructose-1,6-bisphosphatase